LQRGERYDNALRRNGNEMEDTIRRIERLENRTAETDVKVGVFTALFERNMLIQEKLADTISKFSENTNQINVAIAAIQSQVSRLLEDNETLRKDFSSAVTSMQTSQAENSRLIDEEISAIRKEVDAIKETIKQIDEKGKIDVLTIFKNWIVAFLVGGGAFALLDFVVKKIVGGGQ
jgi:predicted  nucleic acid-binding Zn-ribbon protein